ncbi:MAG: leucine-rich repeat domain-containing protein [Clostridia bacterium]|nr:leucine-rich repeat domain-containing protein [Clostridia bacterium]
MKKVVISLLIAALVIPACLSGAFAGLAEDMGSSVEWIDRFDATPPSRRDRQPPQKTPRRRDPDIYEFVDPRVEIVIRDYLGRPNGYIYKDDLLRVTDLYNESGLEDAGITSLEDFRYCTNLKTLWLKDNPVSDLRPLKKLKLKKLNLTSTDVYDLTPISRMTSLTSLFLSKNPQITDLSDISDLYNLKYLYINGCGVEDLDDVLDLDLDYLQLSTWMISTRQINTFQRLHPNCKIKKYNKH